MNVTAWNRRNKREDNFLGLFKNFPSASPRKSKFYDENMENFKIIMKYLTHLNKAGKLTKKQFSTSINWACSKFVENEMVIAIDGVLGKAVKDLEKMYERTKDEW